MCYIAIYNKDEWSVCSRKRYFQFHQNSLKKGRQVFTQGFIKSETCFKYKLLQCKS